MLDDVTWQGSGIATARHVVRVVELAAGARPNQVHWASPLADKMCRMAPCDTDGCREFTKNSVKVLSKSGYVHVERFGELIDIYIAKYGQAEVVSER